jgi:hypothetical protein
VQGVEQQVDQLDPGERHQDPAQAVDQQVAPQQVPALAACTRTPRRASGISTTMIRR